VVRVPVSTEELELTWSKRVKDLVIGLLVVFALVAVFFVVVGVLELLRKSSCDRLDAARVSHLEPGHDNAGPGSIYVKGVGPGPPPSELEQYLEAEAEEMRAGCAVPNPVLPSGD
jgi:hypothetical protein